MKRKKLSYISFCNALLILTLGCSFLTVASTPEEMRALWVTRWDYRSAADVEMIFENAKKTGFNAVFFQVRGEGTVFYKSKIEPWAYELSGENIAALGKDPGWDPLLEAIKSAKKRGTQIHAYMNVLPGWHGSKKAPMGVNQLWNVHRDWFMVDKSGNIMRPEDFYCFLNPALPEVKDYLVNIFTEVAKNYCVDGIHLDYIRYPEEKGDYSYDKKTLALYKKETGLAPSSSKKMWNDWRSKQITDVVRRISHAVKTIRPEIKVSAALIGNYQDAEINHHQQGFEMMKDEIIDIAVPMLYMKNSITYSQNLQEWVKNKGNTKLLSGVWINKGNEIMLEQIKTAREKGADGISIFAYSELFKNHKETDLSKILRESVFKQRSLLK